MILTENKLTFYSKSLDMSIRESERQSTELEAHIFTATPAQCVRIRGFGNSQNQWNSISEVQIYQAAVESAFESVADMLTAEVRYNCNNITLAGV